MSMGIWKKEWLVAKRKRLAKDGEEEEEEDYDGARQAFERLKQALVPESLLESFSPRLELTGFGVVSIGYVCRGVPTGFAKLKFESQQDRIFEWVYIC